MTGCEHVAQFVFCTHEYFMVDQREPWVSIGGQLLPAILYSVNVHVGINTSATDETVK